MKFDPLAKTKTRLYWIWRGILLRTSSSHPAHFSKYKRRGITVCERWKTFENFRHDMGDPLAGMSIDRIDNDGNYEPSNCRWATRSQQMRNRRNSRRITFNGKTLLLVEWAKELSLNPSTITMRLDVYKWSTERALTTGGRRVAL